MLRLRAPLPKWTVGVDMGELPEWDSAARQAGPDTVREVAEALKVDEAALYERAGITRPERAPWMLPEETHRLSPRARTAADELIWAVAQGDTGGAGRVGSQMIRHGVGYLVIPVRPRCGDSYLDQVARFGRKGHQQIDAASEERQDPKG